MAGIFQSLWGTAHLGAAFPIRRHQTVDSVGRHTICRTQPYKSVLVVVGNPVPIHPLEDALMGKPKLASDGRRAAKEFHEVTDGLHAHDIPQSVHKRQREIVNKSAIARRPRRRQGARAMVERPNAAEMLTQFGERLIRAREARGFKKQADFARRLGISQNRLYTWESGRNYPNVQELPLLCDTLDVTIDYLYLGRTRGLSVEMFMALAGDQPSGEKPKVP